jgi:hypothetical protein
MAAKISVDNECEQKKTIFASMSCSETLEGVEVDSGGGGMLGERFYATAQGKSVPGSTQRRETRRPSTKDCFLGLRKVVAADPFVSWLRARAPGAAVLWILDP